MEKIKRSEPVSSVSSVSTQSVPIGRERLSERALSYQTTSWLERAKQYLADLGVEGALVVRVEDVRPVAVHEHAGLVELVVHVAADMGALLDDEHARASALGQLARGHGAGEPAAHHHRVEVAAVEIFEIAVTHTHGAPFRSSKARGRTRAAHPQGGVRPLR